ncbi:MAG: FAD-dependent oxidoreductase [Akkermansia sp.]|nr:FAD-dependent oxidoreductase [Akkermansia sp.]
MRTAIIGAGISGLAAARMAQERGDEVIIFEQGSRVGGLVKCDVVDGVLYHRVGGHVFNSRRSDVLEWFWKHFDREKDFHKAIRHAVVSLQDGSVVDYPIENHLYQMPKELRQAIIADLMEIQQNGYTESHDFDDFLRHRFGKTLYEAYFAPYNKKIWGRSLTDVPLEWLKGKLPMPTVAEIMDANIAREGEMNMVHSSFWYPLRGGSQFPVDVLAQGLDIRCNTSVERAEYREGQWHINGACFDRVIYTGNARKLPRFISGECSLASLASDVEQLEYHGTTSVLCEVDKTPYSWIYMPGSNHESHRIICTGNFSPHNDSRDRSTATVEFSRRMSREEIEQQLAVIPFHPTYISHHWEDCTYPVQTGSTKSIIDQLKAALHPSRFYLLGRFAEWQYYNQDAAIGAALDLFHTPEFR